MELSGAAMSNMDVVAPLKMDINLTGENNLVNNFCQMDALCMTLLLAAHLFWVFIKAHT